MIFNINSTRGHTGSLLVDKIRTDIASISDGQFGCKPGVRYAVGGGVISLYVD